jgi:ribulose-5-phosphate 4-epimerase/fuculose-1-phosphate aldolase
MPDDIRVASLRDKVSKEEWQLRVDLAACYRLIALHGWDDLVFTHVSARVPGSEHHFLINPYGMMFEEITASSLVKVDAQCRKVTDSPFPVNPAGFTIHSAVHAAREDAQCVLHVHTVAGVAVSTQRAGVLPISQQSTIVLASLGYHDYEGIALVEDEKPRLVRDLGTNMFLMLRNHGLLTVGPSIADAFLLMFTFQRTCEIQVAALAGNGAGDKLIQVDPKIVSGVQKNVQAVTKGMMGGLAWPGLLRKLDRDNPGYNT